MVAGAERDSTVGAVERPFVVEWDDGVGPAAWPPLSPRRPPARAWASFRRRSLPLPARALPLSSSLPVSIGGFSRCFLGETCRRMYSIFDAQPQGILVQCSSVEQQREAAMQLAASRTHCPSLFFLCRWQTSRLPQSGQAAHNGSRQHCHGCPVERRRLHRGQCPLARLTILARSGLHRQAGGRCGAASSAPSVPLGPVPNAQFLCGPMTVIVA